MSMSGTTSAASITAGTPAPVTLAFDLAAGFDVGAAFDAATIGGAASMRGGNASV